MTTRACCGNFKLRFEYWPVIWLWPISLVLMQATVLEIGDFAITVAVIACLPPVPGSAMTCRRQPWKSPSIRSLMCLRISGLVGSPLGGHFDPFRLFAQHRRHPIASLIS
jgi:hypothetical protein